MAYFGFCLVVIAVILYGWWWTKNKKYLLWAGGVTLFLIGLPLVLLFAAFEFEGTRIDFPDFGKRAKIVALDKFESFSGKRGDRYYYTVLIKNPPEHPDSLKKLMVRYFLERSFAIGSIDNASHLGSVDFYRYTAKTAYFIDHDEDPGGWSSYTLDRYPEAMIGFILSRYPCDCDSTKHEDILEVYDGSRNRIRDTLRWECGDVVIDNWNMYK